MTKLLATPLRYIWVNFRKKDDIDLISEHSLNLRKKFQGQFLHNFIKISNYLNIFMQIFYHPPNISAALSADIRRNVYG